LNTEVAFFQLVTLELVIKGSFHIREINSEDFEINSIPVKTATLHNNDFVKQNAANTKTNTPLCTGLIVFGF
jgi:hypothetical protein